MVVEMLDALPRTESEHTSSSGSITTGKYEQHIVSMGSCEDVIILGHS